MTDILPKTKRKVHYFPHAKINLGLFITGKRPDGYHLLETLYYPIKNLSDELRIETSEEDGCNLTMEGIEIDGNLSDNLCVKAYKLLAETVGGLGGVKITLKKGIPAGAGLGGGSSDAAFTLKGLNELFELQLKVEELANIGEKLGADVPFFLYEQPMLASGIGTYLMPFEIDIPYELRLITPNIYSSTVAAYKALNYQECTHEFPLSKVLKRPIGEWKHLLVNDLEKPIFKIYPELEILKKSLYEEGALYAAMSGSGSAIFGLFAQENGIE